MSASTAARKYSPVVPNSHNMKQLLKRVEVHAVWLFAMARQWWCVSLDKRGTWIEQYCTLDWFFMLPTWCGYFQICEQVEKLGKKTSLYPIDINYNLHLCDQQHTFLIVLALYFYIYKVRYFSRQILLFRQAARKGVWMIQARQNYFRFEYSRYRSKHPS